MSAFQSHNSLIENGFTSLSMVAGSHPWTLALAALSVSLLFVIHIPQIRIDGSDEAFLFEQDPVRIAYEDFRSLFGGDETIILIVQTPELYRLDTLAELERLHLDLEHEVPDVRKVDSLYRARHTDGRDDLFIVDELSTVWPRSDEALTRFREMVAAHPLYTGLFIGSVANTTALYVWLEADVSDLALNVAAVERVADRYRSDELEIFLSGGAFAEVNIFRSIQEDILILVGASLGIIALTIYIIFRSIAAVILTSVVVFLSLGCTVGAMALIGIPITLPVQVLPSFLLAVGTCDVIHILTQYRRSLAAGTTRAGAVAYALGHSGIPVLLTSLTTAGGLLSFVFSGLAPVAHFGIAGPMGVLFALLFTLTLLPALLVLLPVPSGRVVAPSALMTRCADLASRHPRHVVVSGFIVAGVFGIGIARLDFGHDPLSWFPATHPVREGLTAMEDNLGGSQAYDILVDTGAMDGVREPELLHAIDDFQRWSESVTDGPVAVAKSIAVPDAIKEINQALHAGAKSYYVVPDDELLVAQELFLFESSPSDDIEDLTDRHFQTARITLRVGEHDGIEGVSFIARVADALEEFIGSLAHTVITGGAAVTARTYSEILPSMAKSYAFALLAITPLIMLLLRSVRRGLIAMAPNVLPILMTLGLMGWLGIALDISSMMIAAIVIGVAVDDTIHIVHGISRDRAASETAAEAIHKTLATTGRAIAYTTLILAFGFAVNAFSTMANLVHTGMLTTFAIVCAFVFDVTVTPALLVLTDKR